MTKKESICAECKYHFTEPTNRDEDDHCCNVNAKDVKDYVTGYIDTVGVRDCYDINKDGNCPDFKSNTNKPKTKANDDIDFDF